MDLKKGDKVLCFPQDGSTPLPGKVVMILSESGKKEAVAYGVEHAEGAVKTWLADDILDRVPTGLDVLLKKPVVPANPFSGVHRQELPPAAHGRNLDLDKEEPLFLAFDATDIPEDMKSKAIGQTFAGPEGQRIGTVFKVEGNDFIVEIDEPLVQNMRTQIEAGSVPPKCRVFSFKKEEPAQ